MKVRYTAPTEAFPFFHNVRVQTAKGWQKVISYNDRIGGKDSAMFPTQEDMVQSVRKLVRAGA